MNTWMLSYKVLIIIIRSWLMILSYKLTETVGLFFKFQKHTLHVSQTFFCRVAPPSRFSEIPLSCLPRLPCLATQLPVHPRTLIKPESRLIRRRVPISRPCSAFPLVQIFQPFARLRPLSPQKELSTGITKWPPRKWIRSIRRHPLWFVAPRIVADVGLFVSVLLWSDCKRSTELLLSKSGVEVWRIWIIRARDYSKTFC